MRAILEREKKIERDREKYEEKERKNKLGKEKIREKEKNERNEKVSDAVFPPVKV